MPAFFTVLTTAVSAGLILSGSGAAPGLQRSVTKPMQGLTVTRHVFRLAAGACVRPVPLATGAEGKATARRTSCRNGLSVLQHGARLQRTPVRLLPYGGRCTRAPHPVARRKCP